MLHFDFTVTDLEGEVIFDGLHTLIVQVLQRNMKATIANDSEAIELNEQRIKFLESIIEKMTCVLE